MAAIGADVAGTVSKLLLYPKVKYYVHESVVAKHIGLRNGPVSVRDQMSSLVVAIEKGYAGSRIKKKGNGPWPTGIPTADLKLVGNGTNILCIMNLPVQSRR